METIVERTDGGIEKRRDPQASGRNDPPSKFAANKLLPFAILFAMVCALLLLDAVLPLRPLWFREAQLTQLGTWPVLPSVILFPGKQLIPPVPFLHSRGAPTVVQSWKTLSVLFGAFIVVFLVYLLALRHLPQRITRRYLFGSTVLLGTIYILIPIVTSLDVYSYIAYARIGVIYHLNPLTTIPNVIRFDPIYRYITWTDQPSAYGPVWAAITCFWQWLFTLSGSTYILPMMIALRVWGLLMHLASAWLVWSISGYLLQGGTPTRRVQAALAFAWNPLLLFEACVNAHVDTTMLFFILLAVWFLVRHPRPYDIGMPVLAGVMFAIATCVKLNTVLLVPGLLLYLWQQAPGEDRIRRVVTAGASFLGVVILLYVPFWQGGAIFRVFLVNPATNRTIGTVADFLAHFYNGIVGLLGYPIAAPIGSPAEHFFHTLSLVIFVILYAILFLWMVHAPGRIATITGLIRWMALAWLLYCAIGSPWFWPWYIVTFFGLFALLEASGKEEGALFIEARTGKDKGRPYNGYWFRKDLYFVRLLAFSMLSLYCFFTWGPYHSFVPGLPGFLWWSFNGLWAWLLPLIGTAVLVRWRRKEAGASQAGKHKAPSQRMQHPLFLHDQ